MPRRMGRFSREEWELRQALRASAADAAREEARDELNMQLALEESGQDYWWSQLPPQLCWLRRPDSLQQLLQRPVWLDAWLRGEEARAALLWAKLPDDAMGACAWRRATFEVRTAVDRRACCPGLPGRSTRTHCRAGWPLGLLWVL